MGLKEMDTKLSSEFIRRVPIYPKRSSLRELNAGSLLDRNQLRSIVYRLTFRGCLCEDADEKYCFPCSADKSAMLSLAHQGRLYAESIRRE